MLKSDHALYLPLQKNVATTCQLRRNGRRAANLSATGLSSRYFPPANPVRHIVDNLPSDLESLLLRFPAFQFPFPANNHPQSRRFPLPGAYSFLPSRRPARHPDAFRREGSHILL
ncbi:unnamed protein product [Linum tenue]|uniref:Uncharacterized protein n=1 Tax=Linum tenue TaxID=586396 RepID=A0AAV0Q027_9ROSI|nr:unnamed protein product [Linum tenue]